MITWGDTIKIILAMFEINQDKLADLMGIENYTLSKIKTGQQALPNFIDSEGIYLRIFKPGQQKLSQDNPAALLSVLKEIIEQSFTEVRMQMNDCWDEEDYEIFVMKLLDRTRRTPSVKNKEVQPHISDEKTKKAFLDETPSEQMRRIFEQAVADYNIAVHICKLADYVDDGVLYPKETSDFFDTIQTKILSKYINHQDENIFQKIREFNAELEKYFRFLGMIPPGFESGFEVGAGLTPPLPLCIGFEESYCNSEYEPELKSNFDMESYSLNWRIHQSYQEIFSQINSKRDEFKEEQTDGKYLPTLEDKLIRLDYIETIFSAHKRMCELFGEITDGKSLLVL